MEIKDIIFVPSVQHTGTWFVLKFLERFGFKINTATEIFGGGGNIEEPTVLQAHFPISNDLNSTIETAPPLTLSPISMNGIILLSKLFKTVIPIRDPLAAILTREARHPELRHFYIVDGFIQMAKSLAGNSNVMFLPIDLMKHAGNKRDLLIRILKHCNVPIEHEQEEIVNEVANIWKPENITPNNRFNSLYEKKNMSKIEFLLGPKVAEVEYLKNQAAIILLFMSSLGYTKEDLDLW